MRAWLPALLLSGAAAAQIVPDRELETVKVIFNAGDYQTALKRAREAMALANFTEPQRVELHKYAGLAAFNLGDAPGAEAHFLQLLKLNPDYVLDPFAVAPPAIRAFEEVKRKNADALNLVRQRIALREEQAKREAAEAERRRQEELERKREQQIRASTQIKVIEHRSILTNFVPFGLGQFLQGRTGWGAAFAVVEAILGATSLIGYIAIETLFADEEITIPGRLYGGNANGDYVFTVRKIPADRAGDHRVWNIVKLSSGIGFYVVAALGILDALLHHQGETVSFINAEGAPKARLNVYPLPGGAGVGVSMGF